MYILCWSMQPLKRLKCEARLLDSVGRCNLLKGYSVMLLSSVGLCNFLKG